MPTTDVILFAGQSNMAGRGEVALAPPCPETAGRECRAVSRPGCLVPIAEPFGFAENRTGQIDDGAKKRGGMVPAFVNEYHRLTGRSVVAVSASEGGTSTAQWLERMVEDAAQRLSDTLAYLEREQIAIGRTACLWCQGETDGDFDVTAAQYGANLRRIWQRLQGAGAQTCYLVQIGHFNVPRYPAGVDGVPGAELERRYGVIRQAQQALCEAEPDFVLAASFADHLSEMKDAYHYHQSAYNQVGTAAAKAAAADLKRL